MLEVKNIESKYGNIQAISDVSLSVKRGELVAVVGANGAGKSTTMKTIMGLLKASAGQIIFDNKNITNLPAHDIVNLGIALVPEGRMVFPYFTVLENLNAGAYCIKNKAEVSEGLNYVFSLFPLLKDRLHQKAGTLSGGEQQMLAIGRALMSKPKLLLMDEPSLGLAPVIVDKIIELIQEIHQQGMTILLVEQDVYSALEIADRGYVMENGRIVLEGTANELMESALVQKKYLGIA
ncbi:MAG: branched-chain amino acid transport system ATP-binding protein [Clostridia bacterium]|nr:branched-chain amino acid transport system ATP-binding protein [Clostridia bacterium]